MPLIILPDPSTVVKGHVLLYCRASSRTQRESLEFQVRYCVEYLTKRGFVIFKVFKEVACGRSLYKGRHEFLACRQMARSTGYPIVSYSLLRLIRERHSHDGRIHRDDLDELEGPGIVYATILPPNTPIADIKSEETKRGMYSRGKMGGRTRILTPQVGSEVLKWHEQGNSLRAIARITGIPKSTIADLLQNCPKRVSTI